MITRQYLAPSLFGLAAAAQLAAPVAGGDHRDPSRGFAIASPVDSPDYPSPHAPKSWNSYHMPYYSRTTPISNRWCPTAIVPYYRGYKRNSKVSRETYGHFVGSPDVAGSATPSADYGLYTGAPKDEDRLLRLGGAGPHQGHAGDFIDIIGGTGAP